MNKKLNRDNHYNARKKLQLEKNAALRNSWNPLPEKGQKQTRLSKTIEKNSNFINCRQNYMNVGKYKGIDLKFVPVNYLKWVSDSVQLNQTEKKILTKYIK